MDPFSIASIAAPVAGGILGNVLGGGDDDKAMEARRAALAAIAGVRVPTVEEQRIALQKYQQTGELNPVAEAMIRQDPSLMGGVSTDPRLKDAQMKALSQLQGLGTTGLTAQDRASLGDVRRASMGDAQARDAAILQNMAARGEGGGGAELAARLSSSQGAANLSSQEGDRIAAMAQNKALQAMSQAGSLGGQIRSQEFGEQADKARAQDYINNFNARQSQDVTARNTAQTNSAQQYNLNLKQRVADQNTGVGNQQELHNKGLYQQQFQNNMQKAGAMAGAQNNLAGAYNNQASQTRGMWGTIGQGVGSGFAAAGQANRSQDFLDYLKNSRTGGHSPTGLENAQPIYTTLPASDERPIG